MSRESKNCLRSQRKVAVSLPSMDSSSARSALSSAALTAEAPAVAESPWKAFFLSYSATSSLSSSMSSRYRVAAMATVLVPPHFFGNVAIMFCIICNGGVPECWMSLSSCPSEVRTGSGMRIISAKVQWSVPVGVFFLNLMAALLIASGVKIFLGSLVPALAIFASSPRTAAAAAWKFPCDPAFHFLPQV